VFQCVLANDGLRSFVIFNYVDGLQDLNKLSTVPVQAGINAAHRNNFVSISNTSDISINSNVDIPGVWIFQTNGRSFTKPSKRVKFIGS